MAALMMEKKLQSAKTQNAAGEVCRAMEKQVSALNTLWLVQYIHQYHADVDVGDIVSQVTVRGRYTLENLKTGNVEPVAIRYLCEPDYWFSNQFVVALFTAIQEAIPDPIIFYKMGRTAYKAQQFLKTAIGIPLLGARQVISKVSHEASKFNRTKTYEILKNESGHAIIRITHHPGIDINLLVLQWHQGMFEAYARLSGATEINISFVIVTDDTEVSAHAGQGVCDFDIRYQAPTVPRRIFKIFLGNVPYVLDIVEHAELIQHEHKEQILYCDRIIRERSRKIQQLQEEIAAKEKKVLESRITGGFAHEMRNALAGALLELNACRDHQQTGQSVTDIINEAALQIFRTIDQFQSIYGIAHQEIAERILLPLKTISNIQASLAIAMEGVLGDIERGLAITQQIQDYAKISEILPGDSVVDIIGLLNEFWKKNSIEFKRSGIQFFINGLDRASVYADESLYTPFSATYS